MSSRLSKTSWVYDKGGYGKGESDKKAEEGFSSSGSCRRATTTTILRWRRLKERHHGVPKGDIFKALDQPRGPFVQRGLSP